MKKTFREWRVLVEAHGDIWFDLKKMSKPSKVGRVETPENLDSLTMGQMLTLSRVADGWSLFYDIMHELMGMKPDDVDDADAVEVVRFVGWSVAQLDSLNKRFQRIRQTHTQEEKRAGVERLQFGPFGLVDWYARRMGITNHDDVMDVPALRVWQCLKMDTEQKEFERRLSKVYTEKRK